MSTRECSHGARTATETEMKRVAAMTNAPTTRDSHCPSYFGIQLTHKFLLFIPIFMQLNGIIYTIFMFWKEMQIRLLSHISQNA